MPNEIMKIKKEGMPLHNTPSERGHLYVKLKIQMPKTLNEDQKAALEKIL
jgi:DnaJ-class molecular chaperone